MKPDNPINALHHALAHAVYEGFPEFEYEDRDWSNPDRSARITKKRRHTEYDITVAAVFPQVWSSTALGFGGIGGQAITSAYTIVLESDVDGSFCVYFGGRFAYRIQKPNDDFFIDMINCRNLCEVRGAVGKYESVPF